MRDQRRFVSPPSSTSPNPVTCTSTITAGNTFTTKASNEALNPAKPDCVELNSEAREGSSGLRGAAHFGGHPSLAEGSHLASAAVGMRIPVYWRTDQQVHANAFLHPQWQMEPSGLCRAIRVEAGELICRLTELSHQTRVWIALSLRSNIPTVVVVVYEVPAGFWLPDWQPGCYFCPAENVFGARCTCASRSRRAMSCLE